MILVKASSVHELCTTVSYFSRSRCYSSPFVPQATQAYLAGNKALAKELGAQGRAANDAMKRAHAAASDRIYAARNGQVNSEANPDPTLDPNPNVNANPKPNPNV